MAETLYNSRSCITLLPQGYTCITTKPCAVLPTAQEYQLRYKVIKSEYFPLPTRYWQTLSHSNQEHIKIQ
jgi:hypothetical protein